MKLKIENRNLQGLKDIIIKLQEEKMDLSRKLMEMEGEAVLYKDNININDEILYNPKKESRFSTISQKESYQKISHTSSKEIKTSPMKICSTNFNIISKGNKNEENFLLKKELNKNDKNIYDIKNTKKKKNIDDIFYKNFILKNEPNKKTISDSLFEENESNEIENILEEKRNFVIKTLTIENFSFDIIREKENKKIDINKNNIEQILELIKQRKKKVEMTKKFLKEKII